MELRKLHAKCFMFSVEIDKEIIFQSIKRKNPPVSVVLLRPLSTLRQIGLYQDRLVLK